MKKFALFLVIFFAVSCKNQRLSSKVSFDIVVDGMSCSKSCAPFIKKKLTSTEGVLHARVSYENKLIQVDFNSNDICIEDIVKKIESLNDGSYKTRQVTEQKLEAINPEDFNTKDTKLVEFDIAKPEISHSSGFQLPNLFSLLNSILK